MGTKYNVAAPRPKKDGGSWWHTVGKAFMNDKGQISVYLNSMPLPDPEKDNQIYFILFEDDEERQGSGKPNSQRATPAEAKKASGKAPSGGKKGKNLSEELDDEIPF